MPDSRLPLALMLSLVVTEVALRYEGSSSEKWRHGPIKTLSIESMNPCMRAKIWAEGCDDYSCSLTIRRGSLPTFIWESLCSASIVNLRPAGHDL